MTGPCLCGDPYCPSCGDPGLAALEDWATAFVDKLIEMNITEDEAVYLDNVVPALLESYREGTAKFAKIILEG